MKTEAQREANRRYAERNKEKLKERNLRWRQDHPDLYLLYGAKGRAKKRGILFNIGPEDVIIPTHCPVLGIELTVNYGAVGGQFDSPSIDRIVPELGYVKGNIQIISQQANMMKSNASPEQLKKFAEWVTKTYD